MRVLRPPRPLEIGALLVLAAMTAAPLAAQREPTTRRGWLGFSFGSAVERRRVEPGPLVYMTTDTALAIVNYVLKGSPADRAGMEPGDTLLRVNGERATIERVQQAARRLHPGDTVRLEVRRAGRNQTLTLHAAERPAYLGLEDTPWPVYIGRDFSITGDSIRRYMRVFMDSARMQLDSLHIRPFRFERRDSVMILRRPNGKADTISTWHEGPGLMGFRFGPDSALLGLKDDLLTLQLDRDGMPGFDVEYMGRRGIAGAALEELNPQLAEYFGVHEGLLVERVTAGTPAARAGLQAGDVVTAAGGRPVGDVADLRRALRGREGTVKLDIVRKGKTQSVSIKWP